MSKSVYEIVTEKILEKLQNGTVPWRKPWAINGGAVNWKTQKPYRGINAFLLDAGEYATYKQVTEAGGHVKKGEQAQIVVFWKWLEKKDENDPTAKPEKIPLLRYYNVFEINTQCEGLTSKRKAKESEHTPIEQAENIIDNYLENEHIPLTHKSGSAFYVPSLDCISVPPLKDFPIREEYYSTLFHECAHSTGHATRLNRDGVNGNQKVAFGDDTYSREELVAEMTAAMLCGHVGIDNVTIDNSASYINSWMRKIKEEPRLLVTAASQAQKASDFMLGIKFGGDESAEA